MKLPIPLLLYLTSAGLFGLAGWTFYEMLPFWKPSIREAATTKGQKEALDRITRGHVQNSETSEWKYTVDWWARFKDVNLIGKLPPPPPKGPDETGAPPPPPKVDVRPLEEIIEIVSVVYDGKELGKGGNSYVIVRYKPEANIEPPEWYVRENTPPAGPAANLAGNPPKDVTPTGKASPGRGASMPGRPVAGTRPTTAMPTSMVGREFLQKVWVEGDGDPRHSSFLWPKFSDIKLVRVAASAQAAYFIRVPSPAKAGETVPEPKEEELLKTSMNLSQDLLRELLRLQGRTGEPIQRSEEAPLGVSNAWHEVEETTRFGNEIHIGRKDENRFRENGTEVFEKVNLDTWVSQESKLRGLMVRNVDPQLKSTLGIAEGEVLLEVNGRQVRSKAQALDVGRSDYQRGVRTFVTKWLANGQIVERVYQARNK